MIEKILFQHEVFAHQRTLLQFSVGPFPHDVVMRSIELFGTEVAPAVRAAVAERKGGPPPTSGGAGRAPTPREW